jgi:type I restriction enzyme S subunit
MISALKPYSNYKDSGQEWLGAIPQSWDIQRAKFLFREVDERSTTGKEELLSVSHLTGVTPRSQKTITMFLAKSNIGHKSCRPDDLVINTMWAWMGALGVAKHAGIVSPAYGVYRPRPSTNILPQFADLLFRTPTYVAEYQRRSTGVNSSRMRLYPDQFLRLPVLIPPPNEQAAIVKYMEHIHSRFSSFIRAKRRQIKMIGEARQSIIDDALRLPGTRSVRLSVATEVINRPIERNKLTTYTPIGLFSYGRGIFHKQPTIGADLGDSHFFWVRDGDMVLSGQFAWEGAVALATKKDDGCIASHRYPILRGRAEFAASSVLVALLRTQYGALLLDENSVGAAGRNRPLNVNTLLKEKISIPPLSAQSRISALVMRELQLADYMGRIASAFRQYTARVMDDVVIGRIDVRKAAIALSEEALKAVIVVPGDAVAADEECEEFVEEIQAD